jgi:hypothetical protein
MRKYRITIVVGLITGLLVIAALAVSYMTLSDYPRIVRSAYYRNPSYALKAVVAQHLTRKNISESTAVKKIKEKGLAPTASPRFLGLLNEPHASVDKPIIDRYFGLLSKFHITTTATSFWEIPVDTGLTFVDVGTGKVIYIEMDEVELHSLEHIR